MCHKHAWTFHTYYFILSNNLSRKCYWTHFIDEETGLREFNVFQSKLVGD